jgi:hypothetical protein
MRNFMSDEVNRKEYRAKGANDTVLGGLGWKLTLLVVLL